MRTHIDLLLDEAGGIWHVYAECNGRSLYSRNADVAVRSASTIKMTILLAALRAVSAGDLDLSQEVPVPHERVGGAGVLRLLPSVAALSLREMLGLMMAVSDNTATNAVIDLLGFDSISETATAFGGHHTQLTRFMMDLEAVRSGRDNYVSARELVAAAEALLVPGVILSAELVNVAQEMLSSQQFRERLPALLPSNLVTFHKTGELEGICHDAGVVKLPNGNDLFIAVLGSEITPDDAHTAGDTIARITRQLVALANDEGASQT